MARSKENPLERKIRQSINSRNRFSVSTKDVSVDEVKDFAGLARKLLERSVRYQHRTLEEDNNKRKYARVNTSNPAYDFLIPLDQRSSIPRKILGQGGFGVAMEGRIAPNPESCREMYARWEANKKLEATNIEKYVQEVFKRETKKMKGDDRWEVLEDLYKKALRKTKRKTDQEILEMFEDRFGKIAPNGKCVIKLAWVPADKKRQIDREKRMAGVDHKNIAYIFAVDTVPLEPEEDTPEEEASSIVITAQEYIDNLLTGAEIHQTGLDTRIDFTQQLQEGLREIHMRGFVHRDVKPDNALITKDKTVKIIDMGLLQATDYKESDVTGGGQICGTYAYASPEQVEEAARSEERVILDMKADQYSAGSTLYEYLIGEPPNTMIVQGAGAIQAMLSGVGNRLRPPMPSELKVMQDLIEKYAAENKLTKEEAQKIPEYIDTVLAKMLHKDKNKRYDSVPALLQDLEAIKKGEKPEKVYAELEKAKIKPHKFAAETFQHYIPFLPDEDYADAKKSRKRQSRLEHGHLLWRFAGKPALYAGAAAGATALAAGTVIAIKYPELIEKAIDYIAGK